MKFPLIIFLIIFFGSCCLSQTLPEFEVNHKRSDILTFTNKGSGKLEAWLEVPPWIIPGGWRTYTFTTNNTALMATDESLTSLSDLTIDFSGKVGPNFVVTAHYWWGGYKNPATLDNSSWHWRRNYNGIFSAHTFEHNAQGPITIAYSHGENKNEIIDNKAYQNTIRPNYVLDVNNPETWQGTYNSIKGNGWQSYFAFLNLNWVKNIAETNWGHDYFWDYGPIAWPEKGYLTTSDNKASDGLRHPSSIIYNDDIYVFYVDTSYKTSSDQEDVAGVKVIRANVNDALDVKKYKLYNQGSWQSSLPAGFSAENVLDFLKVHGPKGTVLLGDAGTVRFSVAKIKGTNYFLGLEAYITPDKQYKIAFRFSEDLLVWSERRSIVSYSGWDGNTLGYPIFLNQNGWTNTEIDANNFFVIGSVNGDDEINRLNFSIDCPQILSINTDININNDDTYFNAVNTIAATNFINESSKVYYTTGTKVSLNPGFHAKRGATVRATVKSCRTLTSGYTTGRIDSQNEKGQDFYDREKEEYKIFPNPVREVLKLQLRVKEDSRFTLFIIDINGKVLKEINDQISGSGTHIQEVDMSELKPGIYMYKFQTNDDFFTGKFIKAK